MGKKPERKRVARTRRSDELEESTTARCVPQRSKRASRDHVRSEGLEVGRQRLYHMTSEEWLVYFYHSKANAALDRLWDAVGHKR